MSLSPGRRSADPAPGAPAPPRAGTGNSAAGRPPVIAEPPVGSTRAVPSTIRRKFCLCRCRPEIASTVLCSAVSVKVSGRSSKTTGRYLSFARSRPMAGRGCGGGSNRIASPSAGRPRAPGPRAGRHDGPRPGDPLRRAVRTARGPFPRPIRLFDGEAALGIADAEATGASAPRGTAAAARLPPHPPPCPRPSAAAAGGSHGRGMEGRPPRQSSHGKNSYHERSLTPAGSAPSVAIRRVRGEIADGHHVGGLVSRCRVPPAVAEV